MPRPFNITVKNNKKGLQHKTQMLPADRVSLPGKSQLKKRYIIKCLNYLIDWKP